MTKTPFIICLNVLALLLFVGMVLQERTIPQTERSKVEMVPQEKIKSNLPKTPVKISSTEMPPAPQKIAELQAELVSGPMISVMKSEQTKKEKLELPPPLRFAEREQTKKEKLDAPSPLKFAKSEQTKKEKLELPPPLKFAEREQTKKGELELPPPLKAERKNNARVDRGNSLVAPQPNVIAQSSVISSSKLNPDAITQGPKKVEIEEPKFNTVSKPSFETKKLKERLTISAADINSGMAILRETEQGKPLNFEIFWPQDHGQSEKLYNLLSSCYGMQSALLDDQGNLYFPAKKKGRLPSGFSPLLHQVKQAAASREAQRLNALRERHSLDETAVSLRVHRRTTHAALLSGLERLSSKPLSEYNSISARYEIAGGELAISDIKFNNVSTLGSIALGSSSCG